MTGETSRASRRAPEVTNHHTSDDQRRPRPRRADGARGGAGRREARTATAVESRRHLLRRGRGLCRVDLDLDAAVLRVVVRIGTCRPDGPSRGPRSRTGSAAASGTSARCASLTEFARLSDSSCTRLFGTCPASIRRCALRSRCAPRRTGRPACRPPRRRSRRSDRTAPRLPCRPPSA